MELQDYLKLYPDQSVAKRIKKHGFPKLANQMQECPVMRVDVWDKMHLYDLIICDIDLYDPYAQNYNNIVGAEYLGRFGKIRQRNPNAVILGYFSAGDVKQPASYCMSFSKSFANGFKPEWYLKDKIGGIVKLANLGANGWTFAQNPNTEVNSFIPNLIKNLIIPSNNFDGVFYDWLNTSMFWLNNRNPQPPAPGDQGVDANNDGVVDTQAQFDASYQAGMTKLLINSRTMFPEDFLIMGNVGWSYDPPSYKDYVNGVMLEEFQRPGTPPWKKQMKNYYHYCAFGPKPKTSFLMACDTDKNNFTYFRFSLASALMFDGYFCFTEQGHYLSARWYDEYSVNINSGVSSDSIECKGWMGQPLGHAYNAENPAELLYVNLDSANSDADLKVWRRDFENATVLVNPSLNNKTINLNGKFRKLVGRIDQSFNDGAKLTSIDLPSKTGALILRD